jgi:hypothetical protein
MKKVEALLNQPDNGGALIEHFRQIGKTLAVGTFDHENFGAKANEHADGSHHVLAICTIDYDRKSNTWSRVCRDVTASEGRNVCPNDKPPLHIELYKINRGQLDDLLEKLRVQATKSLTGDQQAPQNELRAA